jgi:hypothetical protein
VRQGYPLSLPLFKVVLKFLAREIRQEEEIKGIQKAKKLSKDPYFQTTYSYILKTQKTTQKLLNTINSYSKVAGYKINLQKSLAFLYTKMNKLRKNMWEQFHLQ